MQVDGFIMLEIMDLTRGDDRRHRAFHRGRAAGDDQLARRRKAMLDKQLVGRLVALDHLQPNYGQSVLPRLIEQGLHDGVANPVASPCSQHAQPGDPAHLRPDAQHP